VEGHRDGSAAEAVSASAAGPSAPDASGKEFETFAEAHYRLLNGFAHLIGVPPDVSEDVVEKALEDLWRNWDRVESPLAWARKAIVNIDRARIRKERNRARAEARYHHERRLTGVPDHTMTSLEDHQWVEQTLEVLPPRQREVFRCHLEGLTTAEICERLGTRPDNVRQNLRLARRTLRGHLEARREREPAADRSAARQREEGSR